MIRLIAAMLAAFAMHVAHADDAPRTATAIVVQDQAALRAAARDSAQQHAVLWAGDALEVRGRRLDFVQVYDHRRERAGFVRASQLRIVSLQPDGAADLLAVLRFLRDAPGSEALGIGYAAAFLRAADAGAIGADAFDILGTLADRLARRASANRIRANDAALAAQLEVAASYGVVIHSYEHDGRMQLCYDGEAFRRVLALPSTAEQKAHAALALTRHECVDPDLTPGARYEHDAWRADVLARVPAAGLPDHVHARIRMRSAAVWAGIAYERSRRGEAVQDAAEQALQHLAAVDARRLAEEDVFAYRDAAVRVGASRWAVEPAVAPPKTGLRIATAAGKPGETCIMLIDDTHDAASPLAQRCTFATVWPQSARVDAAGNTLALAVQPLHAWRELWLFQRGDDGWRIDVVPPAADTPDVGYVEFAGWVPHTRTMLVAREARIAGRHTRTFEVLDLDTLDVKKQAEQPQHLSTFYQWQDAAWKAQTVALR